MRNSTLIIAGLEAQADALEKTAAQMRFIIAQLHQDAEEAARRPSAASKLMLSVKEAADYTGLSEWVVRQLCRDEVIAGVWIGRSIRIPRTELDRYCATLTGADA